MHETGTFLTIEPFDDFTRVVDPSVFGPVPDDCWLGLSDVVGSTAAILSGRYKAVNVAGAAVISAIMNALPGEAFPFVFGGDGASYVIAPGQREAAEQAAAATATFVREELGLDLRVALVPVADIRAAGYDLRVARFATSPHVTYANFAGGGVEWAEQQMKSGRYLLPPAPPGSRPDLSHLSCRWAPIPTQRGVILSLIARPAPDADLEAFARLVRRLLALIASEGGEHGQPGSRTALKLAWTRAGADLEARAHRGGKSLTRSRMEVWVRAVIAHAIMRAGLRVGGFDPARYRATSFDNTDFRKFDDGLRMTLDCSRATADRIEQLLAEAQAAGVLRFGSHRQEAAQMTCIVPSVTADNHLHFLDGAGGGYALAAKRLKEAVATAPH